MGRGTRGGSRSKGGGGSGLTKEESDIITAYQPYARGQITRREAGTIYKASKNGDIEVLPETTKSLYDATNSELRFSSQRYMQDYVYYDRIYAATALIHAGKYKAAQHEIKNWESDMIRRASKKSPYAKYQKK